VASRRRLMLTLVGLACMPPGAAQAPDLAQAERELVERSNAFRQSQGRAATAPNPALAAAAAEFAAFMARTDRYGHEADGRTPAQRAQAKGYAHCMVAENIAMQYRSDGFASSELAQGFAQGWIESPGHRRNLLDAAAADIGIAIARSAASGRYYAVQMFGRPASLRVRFEIGNRSSVNLAYRLGDKRYALAPGVTRRHEECTAPALSLSLPGRDPSTLQPRDGARYRIEGTGDRLRVREG
jgi:uncharacterized protein YkwD